MKKTHNCLLPLCGVLLVLATAACTERKPDTAARSDAPVTHESVADTAGDSHRRDKDYSADASVEAAGAAAQVTAVESQSFGEAASGFLDAVEALVKEAERRRGER